jgi:xylulokinase
VDILSIDLGTSGPKVALVSEEGDLVASATRSVSTLLLPSDGAEQDPRQIWATVLSAAKQVLHEAGQRRSAVAGITVASQYFSIVPVDREIQPVMNLILWMDKRGAPHSQKLYERHPEAFETWLDIHGMIPLPTGNDSLSHMLYVQAERPEVHARTYRYLEAMDFIIAKLTGQCSANICTAFPLLLTDNRDLTRCTYSERLVDLAGIDADKLPPLQPVNSRAGTLRADVAADLGLPPTTPVFSGMNDTHAAAIGTATFQGTHGAINIGTTSQVLAHVGSKKSDLAHAILSMPSPIAGRYMVMAENGLGGKPLDHFLRNIAFATDGLADHAGPNPFATVDDASESVPPGSRGLLFLPWLTGAQAPESHAETRGGFLNLSLHTTRAHMVRAILEGVAFNMRWVLPAVEEFVEQRFDELLFSGGGAMSDAWSQIMADVMDRPVAQLADARYVNTRGTAFLALVELGALRLTDLDKLYCIKRRYTPRREHREIYDKLFAQFVAAFEQNRPIFEALNG